jgi:hypothetical protein
VLTFWPKDNFTQAFLLLFYFDICVFTLFSINNLAILIYIIIQFSQCKTWQFLEKLDNISANNPYIPHKLVQCSWAYLIKLTTHIIRWAFSRKTMGNKFGRNYEPKQSHEHRSKLLQFPYGGSSNRPDDKFPWSRNALTAKCLLVSLCIQKPCVFSILTHEFF